jgi:predicted secreted hydrolase
MKIRIGRRQRGWSFLAVCVGILSFFFARGSSPAWAAENSGDFAQVLEPRAWAFPGDHGRHDGYKTEWWYFSGNLKDKTGRRFGYELTFFRIAMTPRSTTQPATQPGAWPLRDLYFAHAAISDISGRRFVFHDRMQRSRAGLADASASTLDVYLHDWRAKLDNRGRTVLYARENGFEIDLLADPGVGPVLEGPGGVNAKGPNRGQASYYYSEPRMPTQGTLEIAGESFEVAGLSWMDHEFSSNAMSGDQVGWDWVALSLVDHSSLMLYRIRGKTPAADYLSGTLISPQGRPTYISAGEIVMEGSEPWRSEKSGGQYPQRWRIAIPGREPMLVRTLMAGQELLTPETTGVDYFEGAVEASDPAGKPIGEGYLEMTGYATQGQTMLSNVLMLLRLWLTP